MIEIVAPPPAGWPERITVRHHEGTVLIDRDGLVAGSVLVLNWDSVLTGMIAALAVLGYAAEVDPDGGVVVFVRHDPAGWREPGFQLSGRLLP